MRYRGSAVEWRLAEFFAIYFLVDKTEESVITYNVLIFLI